MFNVFENFLIRINKFFFVFQYITKPLSFNPMHVPQQNLDLHKLAQNNAPETLDFGVVSMVYVVFPYFLGYLYYSSHGHQQRTLVRWEYHSDRYYYQL